MAPLIPLIFLQVIKLQQEIDQESEHRAELARMERELALPAQRAVARAKLEKSDEKIQSLALLMLHYCTGLQHCIEQQELEIEKCMEKSTMPAVSSVVESVAMETGVDEGEEVRPAEGIV
jgi:hypothetical protein